MRRCIVDKCTNSDHIILCHRFPKNRLLAQKWQISLNLTDYSLDTLSSKYTVCCQHFDSKDYRNSVSNSLNATAVPKLEGVNPRPAATMRTKNASTELSTPTHWSQTDEKSIGSLNLSGSIELLHREDDPDDATEIDESLSSNTCSNEKLCIIPDELNATDALIQSIDGADFTMLDAAGCTMYMPYIGEKTLDPATDESSAFVLESGQSSDHSNDFRPASTESDVEVLVSEAIFDTQWSETDRNGANQNQSQANTSENAVSPCISYQSDLSNKTNELGLTMLDADFGHLDRFQLIDIIKNQSTKIQHLETKLDAFKLAQEQLFTHFDAFRNSVCGVQL